MLCILGMTLTCLLFVLLGLWIVSLNVGMEIVIFVTYQPVICIRQSIKRAKVHDWLAGNLTECPLVPALTCFFDVGAFLVHGGAQCRRPDVQQPHLFHTTVEHPQRVLFVFVVVV